MSYLPLIRPEWTFALRAVARPDPALVRIRRRGPATAAALAASRARPDLVAPAVLLGVFGYVIANFIGIAIARL